jgi:hypothetical protein
MHAHTHLALNTLQQHAHIGAWAKAHKLLLHSISFALKLQVRVLAFGGCKRERGFVQMLLAALYHRQAIFIILLSAAALLAIAEVAIGPAACKNRANKPS